jgi:hypothetical protein
VCVRRAAALTSGPPDPKLRVLGEMMRTSFDRGFSYAPSPPLLAAGYTPEMHARRAAEWDAKDWAHAGELFFVGARKKAA